MKLAYPICSQDYTGSVMGFSDTYDNVFPLLKEYGYEGIELLIRDPAAVDTEALDKALDTYKLKIAGIGTNPMQKADKLFLLSDDYEIRREARVRCSGLIDLCKRYGANALIGKYRGMINPDIPGCTWDDLMEITHSICREAADKKVKVNLEPQNSANINNLTSIGYALTWIQLCNEGNLGILADIYHMDATEQDICSSMKTAGSKINFIHMSDSERKVPGQGNIDIKSVVRCLSDIGYNGYMSFEINQYPDSITAARECADYIKNCLQ